MTEQLHPCVIDADFAWAMLNTLGGGIDEWDSAIACTNEQIAQTLRVKVETALDSQIGRNLRLQLTEAECFALACAGQNCATRSLPQIQQDWLDKWWRAWRESPFNPHGLEWMEEAS